MKAVTFPVLSCLNWASSIVPVLAQLRHVMACLLGIVVGDTKWDCVIKIWGIHSHELSCQPRAHVVTLIDIIT